MTHSEFVAWREFYRLAPFDDLYRYHRPAALVATSLGGGDVKTRLDWLAPEPEQAVEGWSAADVATFKAMGVKPPPSSSSSSPKRKV
jgi:hypothetical protein